MWEPRIILRDVITEPDPTEGIVNINIIYQPKGSYDSRSMVYPFYLVPPGEEV
jgi:phage baseplate assembly protein W